MDGNGRWAENQGKLRRDGHRAGVDVVKTIVKACIERHIGVLSLWAFGRDNWARPADEVEFIMELFLHSLSKDVDELHKNGVSLRFTGDRSALSKELCDAMELAESRTVANAVLTLNVVINYGGKWDIVQAVKKLAAHAVSGTIALDDIDEDLFSTYLNTEGLPDPDLFIRTSGEQRLSNFFLWQLAYTELYFSEFCWPEFTVTEFEKALSHFGSRERRYGKTSKQIAEEGICSDKEY